jgi:hypothetical protein
MARPCNISSNERGVSTASDVSAAVSVLGSTETSRATEVASGDSLTFEFVETAVRSYSRRVGATLVPPLETEVIESVQWFSQLGAPKSHQATRITSVP